MYSEAQLSAQQARREKIRKTRESGEEEEELVILGRALAHQLERRDTSSKTLQQGSQRTGMILEGIKQEQSSKYVKLAEAW